MILAVHVVREKERASQPASERAIARSTTIKQQQYLLTHVVKIPFWLINCVGYNADFPTVPMHFIERAGAHPMILFARLVYLFVRSSVFFHIPFVCSFVFMRTFKLTIVPSDMDRVYFRYKTVVAVVVG